MPPQSEPPNDQSREGTAPGGPAQPEPATQPAASEYKPEFNQGALFPHEIPSEHWDADFGDNRQVYEGTALPIWVLAGWAVFIIWAMVYLYFGLTKF
jgi:hypothetical protein